MESSSHISFQEGTGSGPRTRSVATSEFSTSTKIKIESYMGWCWGCGLMEATTYMTYHAQVIPRADNVNYLESLGIAEPKTLIGSYMNGLLLCVLCHRAFDLPLNPGWVFFPADLDFFINFELEDRVSRIASPRPRQFPDSATYLEHQKTMQTVSEDAEQPTYVRYTLSPEVMRSFVVDGEKGWHGHPFAAIRNSWRVLGAIRGNVVPLECRQKLMYLLDLYRTPIDEQVPPAPLRGPGPSNEEGDGDSNNDTKGKGKGKKPQPGMRRRARKDPEPPTLASKRQRRQSMAKDDKKVVDIMKWMENIEGCSGTAPPSPVSLQRKKG